MGNDGNSQKQQSLSSSTSSDISKKLKYFHDQIDKFYVTQLSKQQFTQQLFAQIQKMPHPLVGSIKISRTYILQRFFLLLSQNTRTKCVNCKQLKDFVQMIHKNPQKAIQKSFQMIDLDNDKCITDAQFLNYMDNCFISLMVTLQKDITDNHFRVCLKDWVSKNKKQFFDEILKIFHKHKRSDPVKWNYSDFKRWVLSGENWTMDISLGANKYKMPINLLCLFGIPKPI